MSGKLCYGSDYNNAGAGHLRSSKSFCEGAIYRAKGTTLSRPVDDNPHVAGSEASDAWIAGWDRAEAGKGDIPDMSDSCCASVGFVTA